MLSKITSVAFPIGPLGIRAMVSEVCLEWALLSPALRGDLSITVNGIFDQSLLKANVSLISYSIFGWWETAQLHRFFAEYLTVSVGLYDLNGDKMFISLVLDWVYMSKNISLALFWMVFKSRILFCPGPLNLWKHPNPREKSASFLGGTKGKHSMWKFQGELAFVGQRRRKITLWWGCHQTKAPPPTLVLLMLQSPWTTQLTHTWVWTVNTESTGGFHSLGNILSQSELWVWLKWAWVAGKAIFVFEHLFKQSLWRLQLERLPGMDVGGCGQLCSACCGSLLATSPGAQAACRGLPASRTDSKSFLTEMKLVKNPPSLPPLHFPGPAWRVSCWP